MTRLWGILRKKQRIQKQVTVQSASAELGDIRVAVDVICHDLDIPRPLWLNKQEMEMERFGRTAFFADNFVETIAFDRFEIELLREKKEEGSRTGEIDA